MEITYAVYHIDGRVLRGDGKLVQLEHTEIKLIPNFTTRAEAQKFLDETKLIPDRYKSRYFRINRVGWRSM